MRKSKDSPKGYEVVEYKLDPHVEQQQKELKADIELGIKEFNTNTQPRAENYNPSTGAAHMVVAIPRNNRQG